MEEEYYQDEQMTEVIQNNDTERFREEDFQEPTTTGKPAENILSRVFLFQLVICVALLAGLAGLHFMMPELYQEVREELMVTSQGISVHDGIQQGYSKISEFFGNLKPLKAQNQEETSGTSEAAQEDPNGAAVPSNCSLEEVVYDGDATLPLEGTVTSGYGFRESPVSGELEFHNGVDIAAVEGTPIVSMDDGTVEKAEFDESYGNYLLISNANGFSSVYAHCCELLVSQGEQVDKGQTIATVGSTGSATGSHLHFGMKKDGMYINPAGTFSEYL